MAARPVLLTPDDRAEPRDETMHRTQLRDGGGATRMVTVVNLSPNGFMARCDGDIAIGDRVAIVLPVVGEFAGEVRWSLGGRIGCKLTREVPGALYQFVVAAMRRS